MSDQHRRDQIYATPQEAVKAFAFDEKVAAVFGDMINRSVPGYGMILEMIGVIARRYAKPQTRCYDLGCSLGASTLSIRHNLPSEDCSIIAVDNSSAMIDKCRTVLAQDTATAPVELQLADIRDVPVTQASLVVLNFTLQFVPQSDREALLRRIADGMVEGGALILSEKVAFADHQEQAVLTELHHGFKRARGYSDLEIAQKRSALENVLVPETVAAHRERLLHAGFKSVTLWFQCFNFVSILAEK